jgi:hypothetical protein
MHSFHKGRSQGTCSFVRCCFNSFANPVLKLLLSAKVLKIFSIVILIVLLFQTEEGWEEVFDYIFPEDEAIKPNLKLLEMAKSWKKQKEKVKEEGEEEKATS